MAEPLNFQSIIMTLEKFWAEQGCLIWQPYYTQVGAGTMNPGTFLRVLGPEPWKVAYVEPSIRPDDGRYGENPNRMQMHYQYQVILKPDPGNPQEIYLKSLEALGIDPHLHDIRFVEDNWKQPALGAWGLGWEVWLDGQEITQFTYFQQAGGLQLDPVAVELTYGLERIAIALQRVDSFRDIRWSPTRTDGDVNLQAEQEHSKYYFEVADVGRLRQMYDLFEAESRRCLEQDLVLPAYDYLLKCSHTFNVLDTRGAIGVTERQAVFGRMRELARQVSELYVEGRQRLEFPWLSESDGQTASIRAADEVQKRIGLMPYPASAAPFVFEIGVEELPADDVAEALGQLEKRFPALLAELRLSHGEVRVLGTPRRLVVAVEALAPRQDDLEQLVKGPPADRAFDAFGAPTRAAEGFARSKGLAVEDLEVRELDGGRYVAAVVREAGRPAGEVLAEALPDVIAGLRFEQSMRWNASNVAFSRPIRWLLALHGEKPLAFTYAGLQAADSTRGLRTEEPYAIPVQNPAVYFAALSAQGILLDIEERRAAIQAQVEQLAADVGGMVAEDPALLAEVTNLVEAPTALRGTFDAKHLELPREVLISVMKKHQRYFPVEARGGEGERPLLPYFIAVANGRRERLDLIVEGNEHVVRARFADAAYFIREDLKQPLEAYLPRLETLTFQTKLGSMRDKVTRIRKLVDDLAPLAGLDAEALKTAQRAAHLSKADLATQMVVEMTSLQGLMGRRYALASGEPEAVARAIFEHYLPRYAGDAIPGERPGLVVGLADRLDSLAGLFAAGLAPSGNKDPFAQRRAALGLVQNIMEWNLDFDLREGVRLAGNHLPVEASPESQVEVLAFIVERLRYLLLDEGFAYDVVEAAVAALGHKPARARRAVRQLSEWVSRDDWSEILPAYSRCVRITRDLRERYPVDPSRFTEEATEALYRALLDAEARLPAPDERTVDDMLQAFLPMIPAINTFFDRVLVMAEDPVIRQNRLGLVQRIAALAEGVADFSRLEGF